MTIRAIGVALALAALAACGPAGALTLAGFTSPSPAAAVNSPCPAHPGHDSIAAALEAQVLAAGPNPSFIAAWSFVLPREWDPALWTLSWSTEPLDATLDITTNAAYNLKPGDPGYSSFYAGAEMRIQWSPTTEQQSLQWIQGIHTNRPRYTTTEYYLDVFTLRPAQDQPPAYPYSFADHHFYDKPSRWCEADQHIFWTAYLYLARIDRVAKSVTMFEGVQWGFTVDCLVPEPNGLLVLISGGGTCLALLIRRRHGRAW